MAYSVSSDFRNKLYSGESDFRATLTINGTTIPEEQISSISISSPIIDDSQESFYVGTFISQKLTITFHNLNGLNIASGQPVTLSIGQYVNSSWVDVPIGLFLVDDLGENYNTKNEITCLDYAIKFKPNIDYSPCFTDGKATIDTILAYICTTFGVTLGSYPNTNGTFEVATYDGTISGKQWISYIAEIKGCNAKMDRNGALTLVPIKSSSVVTIDATQGSDFVLGERYKITKVIYIDAVRNFTYGNDDNNTLFIRSENPFISQTVVSNIYDVVKNLDVYNIKANNVGDFSLDAWDTITYDVDGDTYNTLNNNSMTYDVTIMGEVNTKIPTKQQSVTTNVVQAGDLNALKFKVSTEVNQLTGEINLRVEKDGVIQAINISPENLTIQGSKLFVEGDELNLTGKQISIASNNFNVDKDGNLECNDAKMKDAKIVGGNLVLYDEEAEEHASIEIYEAEKTNILEIGEDYDLHIIKFIRSSDDALPLIDNHQSMNKVVLGFTTDTSHYTYRFNRTVVEMGEDYYITEFLVEEVFDINTQEMILRNNIWSYSGYLDGIDAQIKINNATIVDEEIEITEYDNTSYSGKINDVTETLYVVTRTTNGSTKLYNDQIITGALLCEEDATVDGDIYLNGTIFNGDRDLFDNETLWSGASYMNASQTVNLKHSDNTTAKISEQPHGIVLVWSAYTSQGAQDYNFHCDFIPKSFVTLSNGGGYTCIMSAQKFGNIATKYIYVTNTQIKGHADNKATGTANGITYNNGAYVLRYVIGV